jgi:hypothetical protein
MKPNLFGVDHTNEKLAISRWEELSQKQNSKIHEIVRTSVMKNWQSPKKPQGKALS